MSIMPGGAPSGRSVLSGIAGAGPRMGTPAESRWMVLARVCTPSSNNLV